MLEKYFSKFLDYLTVEKKVSPSTVAAYKSDFKNFLKFMEQEKIPLFIEAISPTDIYKYIEYISSEEKFNTNTVRRKIHFLKSFYSFLILREYIDKNPLMSIETPKREEKVPVCMLPEEITALIQASSVYGEEYALRDKCIFQAFIYLGISRDELCCLDWDQICFKSHTVRIKKKERIIPIPEPLISDLRLYLKSRLPLTEQAVFTGNRGDRIRPKSINKLFIKYAKLAGLEGKGYSPHKLRHSFVDFLLQNGADLSDVKELLGYKYLGSIKPYIKNNGTAHLRAQIQKLSLAIESH